MSDEAGDRRPPIKSSLLSPRRVGDLNRSRVLQALTDHGPLSRSDLARVAGVTRATMGSIVQSLIDASILEEQEALNSGGIGKPARPVWFAPGAGLAVAASLTPTGVVAGLVDAVGSLRSRLVVPLADPADPRAVPAAILTAVEEVRVGAAPVGIGVAVPGACDTDNGEVLGSSQVPGADGRRIHELLCTTGLPVYIDNDSRAQAAAERWFGAGRGLETFASMQTGDGLGAGIVIDNAIIRSRYGSAGEVGHTCVTPDGEQCPCGLYGCWETIATLRWLRREAVSLGIPNGVATTCEQLVALSDRVAAAADLVERYAVNLSIGLANLNQVLSLEVFILHGDAVGGGESFRRLLERHARARSLARLSVVYSHLGADVTLLGASALVLSETFRLVG